MIFDPIFLPTRMEWFDTELRMLMLEQFSEVILKECSILGIRRYEMYYDDTLIAELDARPVQSERLVVQFNMTRSDWFRITNDGTVIQIPKVCVAFFCWVAHTWPYTPVPSHLSICAVGAVQDIYEYYANMPPLEDSEQEARRQYLAAFAFQRLPSVYLSQQPNVAITRNEEMRPWQKIPDHAWDRCALELYWTGHTRNEIARKVGVEPKTISNRLTDLRKQHGLDIVPTREEIKRRIHQDVSG